MATENFNALVAVTSILLLFSCLEAASGNQTFLYADEIRGLSELPMTELIRIKSSFADEKDFMEDDEESFDVSSRTLSLSLPMALPLKGLNKKPMRRYEEYWEEKGKDTKISKIFQLAVTALSFLAFGGYLLTLVITAIRRNSGNTGNGNVIVLSNLQALQAYNRPKRSVLIFDPAENDFEIEKLYQGMIMLSRTYALYN
ncbi:uncharacterized protein LOC128873479 [Hylaeus volcanicus]|uniref:uncharacterized protein LOC128873479 n=1 Tax=Hylaeus volcanicus TaxID=313075 RepID=UPI0023B803C6|nr:uncharacterized protein LOC128873479 [Hylaeus volcanicus]